MHQKCKISVEQGESLHHEKKKKFQVGVEGIWGCGSGKTDYNLAKIGGDIYLHRKRITESVDRNVLVILYYLYGD